VALSSDLIDQLVSRVTVEVTKQISSLLPSSSSVPALHHNSPPLTEVSVMDPAGSVAPTSQANAVVQDVIQQTHVALTGEPGVTPSSNLPSKGKGTTTDGCHSGFRKAIFVPLQRQPLSKPPRPSLPSSDLNLLIYLIF